MLKRTLHIDEGLFQAVGARERTNLDGATGPMNSEQDIGHDSEVHCIQEMPAVACIAQVKRKLLPTVCQPALVISAHWQVHKSENIEFCHDGETQEDAVKGKAHTP